MSTSIHTLIDAHHAEHTALCARLNAEVDLGLRDHVAAGRQALAHFVWTTDAVARLGSAPRQAHGEGR